MLNHFYFNINNSRFWFFSCQRNMDKILVKGSELALVGHVSATIETVMEWHRDDEIHFWYHEKQEKGIDGEEQAVEKSSFSIGLYSFPLLQKYDCLTMRFVIEEDDDGELSLPPTVQEILAESFAK